MVTYAEPYYRVHLTVGPHTWVVERGDVADYGPLDGLKIGWKNPDNAAWPTQPDIPYASFGVVVADSADFTGVDIGVDVSIALYHVPAGTPLPAGYQDGNAEGDWVPIASFAGRVTDLTARPHRLGMVYDVKALDYMVDLAEARIAASDADAWPGQSIEDRLTLIADLLPDVFGGVPWGMFAGPETGWGIFHANDADTLKSALDWYTEFLSQYVWFGHNDPPVGGGARGYLHANNVAGLYKLDEDPAAMRPPDVQRYNLAWRFRRNATLGIPSWSPCRFRPTGAAGGWRPDPDPDDDQVWEGPGDSAVPGLPAGTAPADALGVIPAGVVEFDAEWSRTKKGRAERVYVQTSVVYVDQPSAKRAGRGIVGIFGYPYSTTPPPTLTIDSTLGYREEAFDLADFLLPEPDQSARWEVDKFRVLADLIPDRLNRANSQSWFYPASFVGTPLRCIAGIPAEQNPNPGTADWYAGILTGAELTLQRGRYWIDFTLSRELPRQTASTILANTGYLSCASMQLDAAQVAVTLADLDPGYILYDYRACRRG